MIHIKNRLSIQKMTQAGQLLLEIFSFLPGIVQPGISTAEIDSWIESQLKIKKLVSRTKGYCGYKHVSCISVNDEVVHGVPRLDRILKDGDVVTIDICASLNGYCADMARNFFVGKPSSEAKKLVAVANSALEKGIEKACVGNRLSDISAAIQQEVESNGFGVVRDFAGHGIGKRMHEEPEILNYGVAGEGPILYEGMTFAIEPMITVGNYDVYVDEYDNWTVRTVDGSLAAHVEDTIAITNQGPVILTREKSQQLKDTSV